MATVHPDRPLTTRERDELQAAVRRILAGECPPRVQQDAVGAYQRAAVHEAAVSSFRFRYDWAKFICLAVAAVAAFAVVAVVAYR